MATLVELIAKTVDTIQDPVFSESDITTKLNLGVFQIAGGVKSTLGDFITPPLPDLFKIATVDTVTDAAYVSMPGTFQRSLQFCSNSQGREIDVYNSMIEFSADYPLMDASRAVEVVVEQGGNIYYQGIPTSAETITIHYFRLPVDMSSSSDVPDGIPLHLTEPLLVNFACKEIFQLQTKDDSSERVVWHTNLYNDALHLLEISIPVDSRSLFLTGTGKNNMTKGA